MVFFNSLPCRSSLHQDSLSISLLHLSPFPCSYLLLLSHLPFPLPLICRRSIRTLSLQGDQLPLSIVSESYDLVLSGLVSTSPLSHQFATPNHRPKSGRQFSDHYRWHQREAIRKQIKGNLPTLVYNPQHANHKYAFIDVSFQPTGRVDLNDTEGGVPGEKCEQDVQGSNAIMTPLTSEDPNSIKIRIPTSFPSRSSQSILTVGTSALDVTTKLAMNMRDDVSGSMLTCSRCDLSVVSTSSAVDNAMKLTIRIPTPSTIHHSGTENESDADDETANERHTFCPVEHRDTLVQIMEQHFCAHPLIPGYSAPTPEGIKAWAVRQIYEFCT